MIKFRNCSYLKSLRRHSEGKNSVITIASGFSFMLENNFPDSVQELAVKIKRHLLKKICIKAWSFYKPENLICYEFTKQHCCKLQAVYSPITVKKFVTMYSGFDPCNKGSFINYVYKFLAFLTTYPPSFTLSTLWNLTFFDYLPTSLWVCEWALKVIYYWDYRKCFLMYRNSLISIVDYLLFRGQLLKQSSILL